MLDIIKQIFLGIMFNFQILPETLITGICILGVILANNSIVIMAAGGIGVQLLATIMGKLIMKFMPGTAVPTSSMDMCQNGFIAKSWSRLLSGNPDTLWHPNAPSIFMATITYFFGYGLAVQTLYSDEIQAGVKQRSVMIGLSIAAALIILCAMIFRCASGCDSILGTTLGAIFGLMVGYLGAIILGYITNRRATNIWGIPLLRNRVRVI